MPFAVCNGAKLSYDVHGACKPTANAMRLAERMRVAELYLVAGGRHGDFLEFSDEAGGVVLDILQRHGLG